MVPPLSVGRGKSGQQVPHPRVDVRRGAPEGRKAGLVGVGSRCRVGNAPVDAPRVLFELRAALTRPVAQRDHGIESATFQAGETSWLLISQVDAELRGHALHGTRMQVWFGTGARARHVQRPSRVVTKQSFGDRGPSAVTGTHEQPGRFVGPAWSAPAKWRHGVLT